MTFLKRDAFYKIFGLLVSGMFSQKSMKAPLSEPKGDCKRSWLDFRVDRLGCKKPWDGRKAFVAHCIMLLQF